jgi:hypothetical protein
VAQLESRSLLHRRGIPEADRAKSNEVVARRSIGPDIPPAAGVIGVALGYRPPLIRIESHLHAFGNTSRTVAGDNVYKDEIAITNDRTLGGREDL